MSLIAHMANIANVARRTKWIHDLMARWQDGKRARWIGGCMDRRIDGWIAK